MSNEPPPTKRGRREYAYRLLAALATALSVTLALIILPAAPAGAASNCRQHVRIWSTDTDNYVSVELSAGEPFPGMLRARAGAAGPWEMFTMCTYGINRFTLKSEANGLFVAVEHGYSGPYQDMLRARTPEAQLGGWEQFLLEDWGDVVSFKTDQNKYVTAEMGYSVPNGEYGMLRGNRTVRGPWESFEYWAP